MKKSLILLFALMTLSGCNTTDPMISGCTHGTTEQNDMCDTFKGLSLFGYDLFYDISFYEYEENEAIDWLTVLYQEPIIYSVLETIDFSYLSFDDVALLHDFPTTGQKSSVNIIYNDGVNEIMTKMFPVEISDASTLTNEDGDTGEVVFGGFSDILGGVAFTFDTHDDYSFVVEYAASISGASGYYKTNGNWEHRFSMADRVGMNVSKTILGFHVDVVTWDDENVERIVETYYVMHNDVIPHSTTLIAPTNHSDAVEVFPTNDGLLYKLTQLYTDTTTQHTIIEIQISEDNTIIDTYDFELAEDNLNVQVDPLSEGEFLLDLYRVSQTRVTIILFNQTTGYFIHYVLPSAYKN